MLRTLTVQATLGIEEAMAIAVLNVVAPKHGEAHPVSGTGCPAAIVRNSRRGGSAEPAAGRFGPGLQRLAVPVRMVGRIIAVEGDPFPFASRHAFHPLHPDGT